MQVFVCHILTAYANLIVRSMLGKVLQCRFQRHKIRHICLDGVYHSVVCHSTLHNVKLPCIEFATTVSHNEVKPINIVFHKTFIVAISLSRFEVEIIYTNHTLCQTDTSHAVGPVIVLLL